MNKNTPKTIEALELLAASKLHHKKAQAYRMLGALLSCARMGDNSTWDGVDNWIDTIGMIDEDVDMWADDLGSVFRFVGHKMHAYADNLKDEKTTTEVDR